LSLRGFTGGGDYLGARDIEDGLEGVITGPPFIGEKTFDNEVKQVCEFPMEISGSDGRKIWSAGKFATTLLMEVLGEDTRKWSYPVAGHFERKSWETSKSSGLSWHFIPNSSAAKPKAPKASTPSLGGSTPAAGEGATTSTKTKTDFIVDGIHFASQEDIKAYLKKTGRKQA
jgi:hypothetical protein